MSNHNNSGTTQKILMGLVVLGTVTDANRAEAVRKQLEQDRELQKTMKAQAMHAKELHHKQQPSQTVHHTQTHKHSTNSQARKHGNKR